MAETLTDVMADLYGHEINCGMESFWDGDWSVWIGDFMNGRKLEDHNVPLSLVPATLRKMGDAYIAQLAQVQA